MSDHGTSSDEGLTSDKRRSSSSSDAQNIKRRASRAGTRSVSTLTTSQLERKRANDREAQRAIRQRTKDYIDQLEKQIADLGAKRDKLTSVMQRNAALEAEVARLRRQVQLGGYCLTCSTRDELPPAMKSRDTNSPHNLQGLLHQLQTGLDTSPDFSTGTTYGSTYSPARASSTAESISSADYSPDLESATSMDDRSIDATARLMAEAGFLLGPYTLSGANVDHWDQSRSEQLKVKDVDELMEDEYETETTGFVISADPPPVGS